VDTICYKFAVYYLSSPILRCTYRAHIETGISRWSKAKYDGGSTSSWNLGSAKI
jgi:hypothetical protein